MKILTFDIGTGTKDVLLYDSERLLENCIKMVVTSPTIVAASRIQKSTEDLYLDGHVVGGGPLTHAVMKHQNAGRKIVFSETAALAVKNTPRKMKEIGIVVGENPGYPTLFLDELQLDVFFNFFDSLNESCESIEGIGIAVQDHGTASDDETDRSFRFDVMLEQLERNPTLDTFVYTPETLPDFFQRMKSAVDYVRERYPEKKMVLMDTCVAAVRGCLASVPDRGGASLVLNVGNSHSMAALVRDNKVLGFFEHHTKMLKKDPQKYVHYLSRLVDGSLTNREVYDDGGEGCFIFESVGHENLSQFLYTGPRRLLLEGLEFPFPCQPTIAVPGGDMMMTGPVGLVDGYATVYNEKFNIH